MSTEAATDPTVLTPELIDRVRKLAPAELLRLRDLIDDDGELDGTPEEIRASWRPEIQRRLDAIARGETKTYTVEETLDYLKTLCEQRGLK